MYYMKHLNWLLNNLEIKCKKCYFPIEQMLQSKVRKFPVMISHLYGIIHTYPPIYYQWDETSNALLHKYQWHELVVARNVQHPK